MSFDGDGEEVDKSARRVCVGSLGAERGQAATRKIDRQGRSKVYQTCKDRMELGYRSAKAMDEDQKWDGARLLGQLVLLIVRTIEGADLRVEEPR
jgi:hypothetical protein